MRSASEPETPAKIVRRFMREAHLNRSAALDTLMGMFSREPDREFRAVDFTREGNVPPGSVHPILRKLTMSGCIEVTYDEPDRRPLSGKRYCLTSSGAAFALRYDQFKMGTSLAHR
jgi:hypothetical protein